MSYEIPYTDQFQAQALHTIFSALGGLQVYGFESASGIVMDDTSSVRQTRIHSEMVNGNVQKYLYTTKVTVSVSRVEVD